MQSLLVVNEQFPGIRNAADGHYDPDTTMVLLTIEYTQRDKEVSRYDL